MTRKKLILIFFSLLFFNSVMSQEKLALTIQEAKAHALSYNKTIKNSGLSIVQSQEKLRETRAAGLPQVNANADYSNAMGAEISIQFNEDMPPSKIPIKPSSNFNLQVGQLLFNGNYLVGVQMAKLGQKLSEKNLIKTEQDIISQVVEGYYLVLISGESLKILRNNMANLQEIYRKTEPMFRVGIIEKVELDQLSVQLNAIDNAVKSAERQYEMAQNLLRIQLGVLANTEIELTQSLSDLIADYEFSGIETDFEPEQNINFQLLEVQEEMTAKQIDLQKANYLPTLTGFYNYTKKILKPAFDMSPAHMVGLQMSIPVFSSGERRSKVRQAKIDLETTRNSKALVEEQLDIQYRQLLFNLKSAIESFHTQQNSINVSRDVYQNLKRKFEQGMISSMELTTADSNYLQAESDYLMSIMQVLQAQNAINTLTGKILNN